MRDILAASVIKLKTFWTTRIFFSEGNVKIKDHFFYKRNTTSNKTAIGINESQESNYTTLFKEIKSTSLCSFSFDKKKFARS